MKISARSFCAVILALLSPIAWAAQNLPEVTVYKSSSCGCCSKWVEHMKANGFSVMVHDTDDVMSHKYRLGVPYGKGSCHTAEVGGYVLEGHVPAKDVKRLLKERPNARGLVVPAMPMGAPGMEGERKDHYKVLLFKADGSSETYSTY